MSISWQEQYIPLKFQLSDFTLFKKYFHLNVCDIGITKNSHHIDLDRVKDTPLKGNQNGFLIHSFPLQGKLPLLSFANEFVIYKSNSYERYYIDLDLSFEEYQNKFSSKTRSTIKRKIKKFEQNCNGRIDFRSYRSDENINEFYQYALQVSEKTYQTRLLDAGIPKSELFREEIYNLSKTNSARAYLLFFENKPVSYLFLRAKSKVLFYNYLGYDPEYSHWSVGTILHWFAIEDIFKENYWELLDFTEGEGQQKSIFSTGSRECANIYLLRKTFPNLIFIFTHLCFNKFSEKMGRFFEIIKIKSSMKKIIRLRLR